MLEVIDIHTYYGGSYVLQGLSFGVGDGSITAFLGRNGMGKTTTIRSIIGFTPPRRGIVRFKNNDITRLQPYRIAQMGLGLVPQGRHIFPSLNVKENLTVAERNSGKRGAWSLERMYTLFPILKERANIKGNFLSGGEQQMLCIGRALLTNPDFLLMDEPSEGLAPLIITELSHIITQLHRTGLSILLVEQNLSLALEVSDYAYIINKGSVAYQSTVDELKKDNEVLTKYVGVSA